MDILNQLARSLLQIGGMSPQQIRQQVRANKKPKPMPKARTSRRAPKPAEPMAGKKASQTNLFSKSGQPRDFRNPTVSANRPPTTTPVRANPKATLNPGPVRPPAPGQMSVFGTNPGAKPSGNFSAPSVPHAGKATLRAQYGADAMKWLRNNSSGARTAAATSRALRIGTGSGVLNKLGALGTALAAVDQAQKVFNPESNILTSLNDLRLVLQHGKRVPGHTRYQAPSEQYGPPAPIGPVQTPEMVANYQAARDQRHAALRADMPAIPAPVSAPAAPQGGSAYAPQAAAPARPNTPQPSAPSAPSAPSKPVDKAYGESGKDLYMAHKKNNPLMQSTFGYQTGEHDKKKDEKPRKRKLTIELD